MYVQIHVSHQISVGLYESSISFYHDLKELPMNISPINENAH